MEHYDELATLFESADADLFKPKEKRKVATADDRLVDGFNVITDFVKKSGRIPDKDAEDMREAMLGVRLAALRADQEKVKKLVEHDELGLLEADRPPESLEELFATDENLFDMGSGLFGVDTLPNGGRLDKNSGDVARRELVKNFHQFRIMFAKKQNGLKAGIYKLVKFRTVAELKLHGFYVVDGMMCYIEHIGKQKEVFGRQKERIRVIFENGTESNMYLRTLSSELYRNGYIVADNIEGEVDDNDDEAVGRIYVLKSLSEAPAISTVKNLYKIGVTTDAVEDRIKNAKTDPTYLLAPVKIVAIYKLTGEYQPIKVESLIHRFFADAKVDMQIIDSLGSSYTPDEWYSVPIEAVEEVVDRITSKTLRGYYYNSRTQQIEETSKIIDAK